MHSDDAIVEVDVRHPGSREGVYRDCVVVEEPLEIRLGHGPIEARRSVPVAVTMRTPGADGELALGFLFAEGLLERHADVRSHGPCGDLDTDMPGNAYRVELQAGLATPQIAKRQSFASSSCGVCGKRSIEDVVAMLPRSSLGDDLRVDARALGSGTEALRDHQPLFARTGAIHGAAALDQSGRLREVREDVGRHNALDKLIGSFFEKDQLPVPMAVIVSGRIGFELVQKAARAGVQILAGVGGASSLAVATADRVGMTVVGFVRAGRMNVYTCPHRIT